MKIKGNRVLIKPDSIETITSGIIHKKTQVNQEGEIIGMPQARSDDFEGLEIGRRVSYLPNGSEPDDEGNAIIPIENILYIYP